jgi:hypothetical protein
MREEAREVSSTKGYHNKIRGFPLNSERVLNYRMSEKSGTNGNFNCFSYFYLQVKVKG